MDLYSKLGVGKDAAPDDIKRAYRRAAKSAHPDGGGTEAKFRSLAHIYKVLSDPDRRARYDETGDETEATADTTLAKTYSVIAGHLDRIVTSPALDFTRTNLVDLLVASIEEQVAATKKLVREVTMKIAAYRRIEKRFRRRDGEKSTIAMLVAGQITTYQRIIDEKTNEVLIANKALEIVKMEEFEIDAVGQRMPFEPTLFGAFTRERMFGR